LKTHGEAAFSYYGPRLWNSLPENLRAAETVDAFKKRLKTHLFKIRLLLDFIDSLLIKLLIIFLFYTILIICFNSMF